MFNIMAKKKEKCPYCQNLYVYLNRHKCKLKPQEGKSSFLLLAGISYYYQGKSNKDIAKTIKAANESYCNIHAMGDLATLYLQQLDNNQDQSEIDKLTAKITAISLNVIDHYFAVF